MNGRKQTSHKLFLPAVAVAVGLALCAAMALAQDNATPGSTAPAEGASAVPRLIKFSGVVSPPNPGAEQTDGKSAPPTTLPITFSLYEAQEGGSPLWSETQSVQLDAQGRYSVLLGATQPEGLPLDLFTSGKAQWLGVQPQLPGAGEQPRVLLVGMPYALKAVDADTLGGLPASAFLQAGATTQALSGAAAGQSSNVPNAQATGQDSGSPLSVGGTGTTDFIPLWTNSTTLGNSVLFQTGTGSTAKVGLNTTTPASLLDVNGAGTVRGTLSLPATGTANASAGKNSQPASLQASAFNSNTKAAVNQTFHLQAEPTGNDTPSPSGKLNLLFASGTGTPAETGLSIASNGKITFATGQTFPGTGTITGVTTASGSGLTGGGTTGTLTLGLQKSCATNQVLQWNGSSWVCATMGTGTIAGVTAGTDLTGGGTSGTVTLNLDTTKVPQLAASNTFSGNQAISGNLSVSGSVSAGTLSGNGAAVSGVNASTLQGNPANSFAFVTATNVFPADQVFSGNNSLMIVGDPGCGTGFSGIGFGQLSNCTNYSLIGDGTSTYINRPSGGTMHIREGNAEQVTIVPGGEVGIGITPSHAMIDTQGPPGATFSGGVFFGSSSSSSNDGAVGVYAEGGPSSSGQGGDGIVAFGASGNPFGLAGDFFGDVSVSGNLTKGGGSFKIDHPLDPANKYLYHSFVESPDMKNIYDGVVVLDGSGEAVVELPDWFGSLNRDFRYQLTAVGAPGPNLYIAQKVQNNSFRIAGGQPGMEVSWQVTGIRQDAWANAHRIPVEVEKSAREQGYYLHPELYGAPEEKGIEWARQPEMMKRIKEQLAKAAAARKH